MKMNKLFKIIFFVACTGLCLPSCDDFFEPQSKSNFTEDVVFESIDYTTQALYSVYAGLASGYMWDQYMFSYMCDTDVETSFNNDDGGRWTVGHYTAYPGNNVLQYTWELLYTMIERANLIIDNLPDGPLWTGLHEREAKRIYGEAVALRAYCYYLLIGFWGDVPFHKESTKATGNLYIPKTPRDEIYEHLVQELADIQNYLPWSTDAITTKRISKGFVKGLRAKMALMYAGYSLRGSSEQYITRTGPKRQEFYEIARQESWEVMTSGKHNLKPDWVAIFKDLHEYKMDTDNGEIMFEVAFGRTVSGRVGSSVGMQHALTPSEPKYGAAPGEYKVNIHFYYTFDRKDQRRDVTCELYNYGNTTTYLSMQRLISANGTSHNITKFRRSWIVPNMGGGLADNRLTGVSFPLMRYTDLVLLFAETENELNDGPTPEAKEALASVRRRAFAEEDWDKKVDHYIDSVAADKDKFFNALVDERAWELGGEFCRKFDLIRWNLLGAKKDHIWYAARHVNRTPTDMPGEPPYDNVPNRIFWRESPDNPEILEIYNRDFRVVQTSIAGWSPTTWYGSMNEGSINYFMDNSLPNVMKGYKKERNNYLLPIPQSVIDASRGTIENDHWYPWEQN